MMTIRRIRFFTRGKGYRKQRISASNEETIAKLSIINPKYPRFWPLERTIFLDWVGGFLFFLSLAFWLN